MQLVLISASAKVAMLTAEGFRFFRAVMDEDESFNHIL
jgi:hypothetical protein